MPLPARIVLLSSFSLNMLPVAAQRVSLEPLTLERARLTAATIDPADCYIGHANTAEFVSEQLGRTFEPNRATITLDLNTTTALVGQYTGPRLAEGATRLPEGATIQYWLVSGE